MPAVACWLLVLLNAAAAYLRALARGDRRTFARFFETLEERR